MSIFSAKPEAPTVTGVEILRQALYSRLARGGLPMIASNLGGVGIAALESFARNQGSLPPNILALLTKELFGGHIELSETGLLRSANRTPPIAGGMRPPSVSEMNLDKSHLTPRVPPKTTAQPQPAWPRRAGWAE